MSEPVNVYLKWFYESSVKQLWMFGEHFSGENGGEGGPTTRRGYRSRRGYRWWETVSSIQYLVFSVLYSVSSIK